MKQNTLVLILRAILLTLGLCFQQDAWSGPTPRPTVASIPFDLAYHHMEGSKIFVKSKSKPSMYSIKINLFDLSYLGTLNVKDASPYFLFSANSCKDCLIDRAIYAIRATGERPGTFVYPGKIIDPRKRSLVYQSRSFIGKCLQGRGDVYVSFQKEKVDRRRFLQASVFIAEASKYHLNETLLERRLPNINYTLQLVKMGQCREISGRNRFQTGLKVNLHPNTKVDVDVTDSDDD